MQKFPSQTELKANRELLENNIASRPLSKSASAIDRVKFRICEKFVIYKNTHKLTLKALAQKVNIEPELMNKILHYHFDELTVEKLVQFLTCIYHEIDLTFEVS